MTLLPGTVLTIFLFNSADINEIMLFIALKQISLQLIDKTMMAAHFGAANKIIFLCFYLVRQR
jgi:hypothetical protein